MSELQKGKSVVCIKLVTGEELIGRYVDSSDTAVYLEKPFSLIMQDRELGMMPYCISAADGTFGINLHNIVSLPAKVSKNFEEGWVHHTSNIKIASANEVSAIATK